MSGSEPRALQTHVPHQWTEERAASLVTRLRRASTDRARGGRAWADYADAADCIEALTRELEAVDRAIDRLQKIVDGIAAKIPESSGLDKRIGGE